MWTDNQKAERPKAACSMCGRDGDGKDICHRCAEALAAVIRIAMDPIAKAGMQAASQAFGAVALKLFIDQWEDKLTDELRVTPDKIIAVILHAVADEVLACQGPSALKRDESLTRIENGVRARLKVLSKIIATDALGASRRMMDACVAAKKDDETLRAMNSEVPS